MLRTLAAGLLSVFVAALLIGLAVASSALGASTWLPAEELAGKSQGSGSRPEVAVESNGEAFSVWSREPEDAGERVIESSMRTPGSGKWQAPERLSPEGESTAWPVLAIDANGDVDAVWEGHREGVSDVEAAVRPAGSGAWSAAVQLSTDDGEYVGLPQLAVDPEGDAVAIWTREKSMDNDVIEVSAKPHGENTWQPPVTISAEGDIAGSPEIAMNADGTAVAVWQRYGNCDKVEAAVMTSPSGAWEAPVPLSGPSGQECAYGPRVAVDPAGDAVAAWENSGVIEADLLPADSDDWETPLAISSPDMQATEPTVAIDGAGDAVVAWESLTDAEDRIEAAVRPTSTGTWGAPSTLSTSGKREPNIGEFPHVAMDAQGEAIAAWDQFSNGSYVVEAARMPDPTGAWQTPTALSGLGQDSYFPWLAIFPQGDAVAIWEVQAENVTVEAAGYDGAGPMLDGLEVPARATAGEPITLSVSPLSPWSALAQTTWSFGDGASASGSRVEHTYATAGTYDLTVTGADVLGNTNSLSTYIAVGPTPSGNPCGCLETIARPVIRSARVTHRRFRITGHSTAVSASITPRGTTFQFTLSTEATVQIVISATSPGLRHDGSCKMRSTKLERAHSRRCTLVRSIATLTRASEGPGVDNVAFTGRIDRHGLTPGTYRAVLRASNGAGRSEPVTLGFTIVK